MTFIISDSMTEQHDSLQMWVFIIFFQTKMSVSCRIHNARSSKMNSRFSAPKIAATTSKELISEWHLRYSPVTRTVGGGFITSAALD